MDCPHCGALLPEDQKTCPACGGQARKRGFWRWLWQFLLRALTSRIKVTTKLEKFTFINQEPGKEQKFYSIDELPAELRVKVEEARATGQVQMLHMEHIPPELRAKMEEAKASGKSQLVTIDQFSPELSAKVKDAITSGQAVATQSFSYQGPDGKRQVYHSLEELPPELRAKIEDAIKLGHSSANALFSYEGPDGQKRTYHSLEEMPPDIRALFQ
jgi:hypothetical protein